MHFKLVLLNIVFVFFYCINGFSQSNKNFLIVENPFELKVYNKYEQNLSSSDSSYFLPYCPIEIIAEDTLLSDEYTPTFIGKIENQVFYFIKPEKNLSFTKLFKAYSDYVKNAYSLNDTIQIVQENKIIFHNAKDKNQREHLKLDTKILRIFKDASKTFVKNLTPPIKYGWCDLKNTNAWIVYQSPQKGKVENIAEVESLIKQKLSNVNEMIQKLFNHFNKLNSNNIPIPYWTYSNRENEFVCTMLNNENKYDFTESTNIVINEFQLALAHTNYKVLWQSNEILIQKAK